MDEDSSAPANQSADEQSRRPSSLLISNYSLEGRAYMSSTRPGANKTLGRTLATSDGWSEELGGGQLDDEGEGRQQLERQRPRPGRRRSSSLGQYLAHALAMGHKTNYLFACILFLNLLMSVANTILLSLAVKSVQMGDLSLLTSAGGRAFEWNPQLAGIELHLPVGSSGARIAGGHLGAKPALFVQSIESLESRPLTIASASGTTSAATTTTNQHQDAAGGQILISSARASDASAEVSPSNRLVIRPDDGNSATLDARRVEIVTNNLVLDQLTPSARHQTGGLKLAPTTANDGHQQRRLLEFDGEQQLIALPATNQLKLYPPGASALIVRAELRGQQSELSGTLGADLDIQTRHGNLTCESRQALRLVSRSARLNLAARRALLIGAAQLRLEAKRLHLAEGVEFLDAAAGAGELRPPAGTKRAANGQAPLRAYNLVLIDGQLMAAAGPSNGVADDNQ